MKHLSLVFICSSIVTGFFAQESADTLLIEQHLTAITKTDNYRNYKNVATLDSVAAYIYTEFDKYADTTYYQEFNVGGRIYRNVICVFDPEVSSTIVIGAHYDVCGDQEGADDNASGVVGLLELARLLDLQDVNHRIELVAYTLEEPPFFRTESMGSYVHAKSLKDRDAEVYGMISLEMLGYFEDSKGSQSYPLGFFSLFYGKRGNYITLVNKMKKGEFARKFNKRFKRSDMIRTKKFVAPKSVTGVDFSDHLNYWEFNYSALMISDTAFYRNRNYHQPTDTMEKLNLPKMACVIDAVLASLVQF